jgi:rhamnosyltransferase
MDRTVSVIVRAKDKADTIGATLSALRRQTVPAEIIVVDSGSTDGTLDIAERYADRIVHIPPGRFSYGGALNAGAAVAGGDVHAALSAHCVPTADSWLADSLRRYDLPGVVATAWALLVPDGSRLIEGTYLQDREDARSHPTWGFSNHGSTWAAETWRAHVFREDLPACEDREWSWRVLAAGNRIAYSPELHVPMNHRRQAGPLALYRRVRREAETLASLGALPEPSVRALLREWWHPATPLASPYPAALRRVGPYRGIELLATHAGIRSASRIASASVQSPAVRSAVPDDAAVPLPRHGADASAHSRR